MSSSIQKSSSYCNFIQESSQKPLTKVALFVITLLAVLAGIAFHFSGLGVASVLVSGLVGGSSFSLFILTSLCSMRKNNVPAADQQDCSPDLKSISESHHNLASPVSVEAPEGIEDKREEPTPQLVIPTELNESFVNELRNLFASSTNYDAIRGRIQLLLDRIRDRGELKILLGGLIRAQFIPLLHLSELLENLRWRVGTEDKIGLLSRQITSFFQTRPPQFERNLRFKSPVLRWTLKLEDFLGTNEMKSDHQVLPASIAKSLLELIRLHAEYAARNQSDLTPGTDEQDKSKTGCLGLNIENSNFTFAFLKPIFVKWQKSLKVLDVQGKLVESDLPFLRTFIEANPQISFLSIKVDQAVRRESLENFKKAFRGHFRYSI